MLTAIVAWRKKCTGECLKETGHVRARQMVYVAHVENKCERNCDKKATLYTWKCKEMDGNANYYNLYAIYYMICGKINKA